MPLGTPHRLVLGAADRFPRRQTGLRLRAGNVGVFEDVERHGPRRECRARPEGAVLATDLLDAGAESDTVRLVGKGRGADADARTDAAGNDTERDREGDRYADRHSVQLAAVGPAGAVREVL